MKIVLDPFGKGPFAVHHSYPEIVIPDLTVGIGVVPCGVVASQGVKRKIHWRPISRRTLYLHLEFLDDLALFQILDV